jgi:hypothetical protein
MNSSIIAGQNYELLTDNDIKRNAYSYDLGTLEWNIRYSFLSLRLLVNYQILSPYICAKYVVFGGRNEKYADCGEDAWISTSEIPGYQPHITMADMKAAHAIANVEDEEEEAAELLAALEAARKKNE